MQQLGVDGVKAKISLTTLEKKNSYVSSSIIQDLKASDLDENSFISLPVVFTTKEIPVTQSDTPTHKDVEQWKHLEGIELPQIDAQIGLLIGSNVPEALDHLEVRNSRKWWTVCYKNSTVVVD